MKREGRRFGHIIIDVIARTPEGWRNGLLVERTIFKATLLNLEHLIIVRCGATVRTVPRSVERIFAELLRVTGP